MKVPFKHRCDTMPKYIIRIFMSDSSQPRMLIENNKTSRTQIDIHYCPYCGVKLNP